MKKRGHAVIGKKARLELINSNCEKLVAEKHGEFLKNRLHKNGSSVQNKYARLNDSTRLRNFLLYENIFNINSADRIVIYYL